MSIYAELLSVVDAEIADANKQAGIVKTIWSDDGESSYHIKRVSGGYVCTCPGWQNRHICKHMTQHVENLGGVQYAQCAFCHQPKELNSSKYCSGRCVQLANIAEVKKGNATVKAMAAH